MIPQLALVGLLASAPTQQGGLTPTLTQRLERDTDWLDAGERAPWPGVLIKKVALGRLIGEVEAGPRLCEARVRDQQTVCQEHLQRQAGQHLERIKPLTERIEELQRRRSLLTEQIARSKERLRWWRVGGVAGGSALISAITYIIISR
jgi:hypothetical protein